MYTEKAVVRVNRDLKVHTCHYPNQAATCTIILVNGSMATSASFNQTLRYLLPLYNVVLFDMPWSGESRHFNPDLPMVDKADEVVILLELIEHFRADYLMCFSWGGVAALLALAQRPTRIKRAVISSFSPVLNPAMQNYLGAAQQHLAALDRRAIGELLNDSIGEYLPPFFKRVNFRHVTTLPEQEYAQILSHIRQVVGLKQNHYMKCVGNIDIPLLFINGEWDRYSTPQDARQFAELAPAAEFEVIAHTGHFLEMEHKTAWQDVRAAVARFLLAEYSYRPLTQQGGQSMAMVG